MWNVEAAEPINVFSSTHNDTIFSINWNREGSLFTTTCKDKRVRVLDPRLASVAIVRTISSPSLFSSPLPLFLVSGNAISSRLKSFQKCFPSQRSSLHVWLLQVARTTTTYLGSRKYSKIYKHTSTDCYSVMLRIFSHGLAQDAAAVKNRCYRFVQWSSLSVLRFRHQHRLPRRKSPLFHIPHFLTLPVVT